MVNGLPKKYSSTKNKDRVRDEDTKLIKNEFLRKGKRLNYLGMPSGKIKDILTWRKYLEKFTAIEIDETQRGEMVLNAAREGISGNLNILFGDIEEILISGKDKFGNRLNCPYDIIFLDFFGPIFYVGFSRVKAISALVQKQVGHPFLLLITLNLRERRYSKAKCIKEINKIKKELLRVFSDIVIQKNIEQIFEWYSNPKTDEMYRQKLFVPYFIKNISENCGFKVHVYTPIFYKGFNKQPMIHFIFRLEPEQNCVLRAFSNQSILDIINIKIKEAKGGRVNLLKFQAPSLANI